MKLTEESKYRLMWMMVMFDLPVVERDDQRVAAKFRSFLIDMGFEMSQYSVYFRFCGTREETEKFIRAIRKNVPQKGHISILFFTDKQFGEIINLRGRKAVENPQKPQQLTLF